MLHVLNIPEFYSSQVNCKLRQLHMHEMFSINYYPWVLFFSDLSSLYSTEKNTRVLSWIVLAAYVLQFALKGNCHVDDNG